MSDLMAKMHQIRFRLGLCPRPPVGPRGAYSTLPDPLAEVKGRKGNGMEGGGRGRERRAVADQGGSWDMPPLADGLEVEVLVHLTSVMSL